jgi:hypothetical protein
MHFILSDIFPEKIQEYIPEDANQNLIVIELGGMPLSIRWLHPAVVRNTLENLGGAWWNQLNEKSYLFKITILKL